MQAYSCPKCGAIVYPPTKFCSSCGQKFHWPRQLGSYRQPGQLKPKPRITWPTVIIGLLVAGVVVGLITVLPGWISSDSTPSSTPPTSSPPQEQLPPEQEPLPEEPPAKLQIDGVTTYSDGGYFYIVGEVSNTTNSNIKFVEIVATFYDNAQTVIGTDFTYAELDIMRPDDVAPFEVSSYPDEIHPASYKLSSQYTTTGEQLFAGLRIKSDSASISRGYYEIVGEAENTSTTPANFVSIVATFYDSSGDVIGTDFTYTETDVVEAGSTAPFDLSSYPRKISPASYKLQVQGQ